MAKLVSDPWVCAAVTSRVGLCAHFIHQFSAGLAVLESARILRGRASGLDVQGRGSRRGWRGSLNLRRASPSSAGALLPFLGVRSQQPATSDAMHSAFLGLFI